MCNTICTLLPLHLSTMKPLNVQNSILRTRYKIMQIKMKGKKESAQNMQLFEAF